MNPHWLAIPQYGACIMGGFYLTNNKTLGFLCLAIGVFLAFYKWHLIKGDKK